MAKNIFNMSDDMIKAVRERARGGEVNEETFEFEPKGVKDFEAVFCKKSKKLFLPFGEVDLSGEPPYIITFDSGVVEKFRE